MIGLLRRFLRCAELLRPVAAPSCTATICPIFILKAQSAAWRSKVYICLGVTPDGQIYFKHHQTYIETYPHTPIRSDVVSPDYASHSTAVSIRIVPLFPSCRYNNLTEFAMAGLLTHRNSHSGWNVRSWPRKCRNQQRPWVSADRR